MSTELEYECKCPFCGNYTKTTIEDPAPCSLGVGLVFKCQAEHTFRTSPAAFKPCRLCSGVLTPLGDNCKKCAEELFAAKQAAADQESIRKHKEKAEQDEKAKLLRLQNHQ